ncbi:helix-turn-helix domain-containing protein [Sporolactobacillus nakayamae]|uniref:PucR C-terminal helix-turn-helix domain-containing protein n=1 Tax=Sporolactobacillus nakayamae TaxID=269670 RepID=A0A1I2TTT7_9BACL|nr:helix-turn-helix domain-containing protein [Sporolactobacillus nakayamae]SFG67619.1 PucR C-terminal helix-turn-helix domain-containing protein [Sporolactobacillus nakayamae]
MNVKQLIQNYPGTKIDKVPFKPEEESLYFYEEPYYLAIPKKSISDQECFLFKALLNRELPPEYSKHAELWYRVLIRDQQIQREERDNRVSIIQFQLAATLSPEDLFEWRRALEAFFDSSAAFIYLSSRKGLVVVEDDFPVTEDELTSIANTLENDFSVKGYFQIGLRHPLSPIIRKVFLEEHRLFEQTVTQTSKAVTCVEANFFLLLKPLTKESKILDETRTLIAKDQSWISIIRSIWEHQGNISLAAKKLYMHRNTLQYRIDKFYESTGISLKRMDGLTIAYLASL